MSDSHMAHVAEILRVKSQKLMGKLSLYFTFTL